MTETFGSAPLYRLPDRGHTERLAGVDGEMRVLATQIFESLQVQNRREAVFGTCDIESDDTAIAVLHDHLGDLDAPVGVAHRRQKLTDGDLVALIAGLGTPQIDSGLHGFDRFSQTQPAAQMLFGCPAQFGIHYRVAG